MSTYLSPAMIKHLQDERVTELAQFSDLRLMAMRDYLADYLDDETTRRSTTKEDIEYYEAILCEMNDRGLR